MFLLNEERKPRGVPRYAGLRSRGFLLPDRLHSELRLVAVHADAHNLVGGFQAHHDAGKLRNGFCLEFADNGTVAGPHLDFAVGEAIRPAALGRASNQLALISGQNQPGDDDAVIEGA